MSFSALTSMLVSFLQFLTKNHGGGPLGQARLTFVLTLVLIS